MLVEFVVGSRPCSEGFSPGTLVFPLLKNQHSQIPIRSGECLQLALCAKYIDTFKSKVIKNKQTNKRRKEVTLPTNEGMNATKNNSFQRQSIYLVPMRTESSPRYSLIRTRCVM